ncbi:MAG: ABC transporter ATP-binding protein [Flavobacteriaceae bacterium]|nr:ABC transporter ATP-binding protein [Flavobacteriaceae bacterium]MBT4062957.1 ABC transporter ATP-binding protein [Flavobacteriaceae bacterium]MBT5012246.1 ABC transporter ATP-binding protein [Flavobacteriaceae bacterium]MBT6688752.1 ABC transporter ATP-binding protein [Flavobacteriaceae bacterium]MBT7010536.1 ABC transporter ATP-binding protein [Flavobacteriaceae bacterium]
MKTSKLLSVKNLCISISKIPILKNISFELNSNEILGFVGESGSGKSITAFSIINLFNSKNIIKTGSINFDGKPIDSLSFIDFEKIRGNEISIIFQEPMSSLNPSMKCGEQVIEIILNHEFISTKKAKNRVIDLLKKVQLNDPEIVYNKYPHQLSGGQQQRIMIAMAISCNPKILIADEPTTSLDGIVKKGIISLLKSIQKETKMSIIFISHDLPLVSKIAKKIIVLNKGKIVETGTSNQIFKSPKKLYTKLLLNARPPKNIRPKRLPTNENNIAKPVLISKQERIKTHAKIYQSSPILKIKNLEFSYNNNKVLNDVSFDLYKGETLGLVGESGSGKSTIAKSILNLNDFNKGQILYKENDIKKINKKDFRKNIQLIFQDPFSSLNPEISIGYSIIEPMLSHGIYETKIESKEKAISLLEQVKLNKSDFNKFPHQFSGGQRQRIVIARALALNPKILICDESVSALDVSIQAQVLNLLNDLKETFSFTFLFISHDLSVVKYMSDRVIILNKGVIEESNETDHLFANPKKDYTKNLLLANDY